MASTLDGSKSKVHFDDSQSDTLPHNLEIPLKYGEDRIDAHLGFVQLNRHYDITLAIQDDLGEDLDFDPLENLHARLTNYSPTEDGLGHNLSVELHAHREKLMQERFTIRSKADPSKWKHIILHARVLGKGKGTPALRNGIKCRFVDDDNDSDVTDWQGFD